MGKNNKKLFLIFIAALLIAFLIRASLSFTFFKELSLNISKIPLKLISLTFAPYKTFIHINRSLKKIDELKEENLSLKLLTIQLQDIKSENERLRKLLSFRKQFKFSVIASSVIGWDVSNFKRTLIIDKGRKHGISVGDPVLGSESMIGMVIEVGNSSSRVILINDPDFSMAAKDRRSRAIGIISGSLEGVCVFKYLDLDEDIRVGDEIISAGGKSRFPSDIPVGEIISITKDSSGLNMLAVVQPSTKLSTLEEVLIVISD